MAKKKKKEKEDLSKKGFRNGIKQNCVRRKYKNIKERRKSAS